MSGFRILVASHGTGDTHSVVPLLRAGGLEVVSSSVASDDLRGMEDQNIGVVVLDLGDSSADDVISSWARDCRAPLLVLSTRGTEADTVRALDAGADGYITTPFGRDELLARVRAALRRANPQAVNRASVARSSFAVDGERHRVLGDARDARLTPREFELLTFLAQHPGRVLTHRTIVRAVWGPQATDPQRHLRVLVRSLRKKIEPTPSVPRYILTEPWVGYCFAEA